MIESLVSVLVNSIYPQSIISNQHINFAPTHAVHVVTTNISLPKNDLVY